MIDPKLKRALGQMIKGVQVVATTHGGETRAYTSHWVGQVAFDHPIVMASVSPKHDTYPLLVASGWYTVSILAGDQLDEGQYFSYPGRRFHYLATEWLTVTEQGWPVVPNCIAWLYCEVFERKPMFDHELFFSEVKGYGYGRLKEPPLVYSARHGWRIASERARKPGESPRDRLLRRLADAGYDANVPVDDDE
jgi:flavin reductase (DIM6/NTAB) family NADH-FMN oxidoreductase RutF